MPLFRFLYRDRLDTFLLDFFPAVVMKKAEILGIHSLAAFERTAGDKIICNSGIWNEIQIEMVA